MKFNNPFVWIIGALIVLVGGGAAYKYMSKGSSYKSSWNNPPPFAMRDTSGSIPNSVGMGGTGMKPLGCGCESKSK